jgi:hypothetical protein
MEMFSGNAKTYIQLSGAFYLGSIIFTAYAIIQLNSR